MSAAYRNYLDLLADEEIDIATLLIECLRSDSEDSYPDIDRRRRRKMNFTRRARMAPLTFRGR